MSACLPFCNPRRPQGGTEPLCSPLKKITNSLGTALHSFAQLWVVHIGCTPGQCLRPPGWVGHKSLSKKSVSHSEKKVSQSLHPPGGGLLGQKSPFQGILRQKSLKIFRRLRRQPNIAFWRTPPPGGSLAQNFRKVSQSLSKSQSISPPRGCRRPLSTGLISHLRDSTVRYYSMKF